MILITIYGEMCGRRQTKNKLFLQRRKVLSEPTTIFQTGTIDGWKIGVEDPIFLSNHKSTIFNSIFFLTQGKKFRKFDSLLKARINRTSKAQLFKHFFADKVFNVAFSLQTRIAHEAVNFL